MILYVTHNGYESYLVTQCVLIKAHACPGIEFNMMNGRNPLRTAKTSNPRRGRAQQSHSTLVHTRMTYVEENADCTGLHRLEAVKVKVLRRLAFQKPPNTRITATICHLRAKAMKRLSDLSALQAA